MSKTRLSKVERLREEIKPYGLLVFTYSPGDGVTRYRFSLAEKEPSGYFSAYGMYTALGWKEADTFATGFCQGVARGFRQGVANVKEVPFEL